MATSEDRAPSAFTVAVLLLGAGLLMQPVFAQQIADYTLNPGDELGISVWKDLELTKPVIVRPDGKFSFPLTGDTVAIGKTVAQVQTEIAAKLKTYIPEPVVTVSLTAMNGNRIYVIGQVTKPGAYVMNPRLNVLQALSLAGGMTPFAALNDIIVIRGGARSGQQVLPFRYTDVSKGRALEQNVTLEAGDVVVVP